MSHRSPRAVHTMALVEKARVARFFLALAVKEHVAPDLHVRPLVAELFLSENCNLRCISCACWRETTRHELSTEEWERVVDQLVACRILKVNFTGGEPLIRADAVHLMAYARHRGVRTLHLNTNGILLNDERRAAVLAAGVRSFNVSIDGPTPQSHDGIRGVGGAFATTMANLQALAAERQRLRLKLRLNFTVLRDNVALLPEMARLAQRLRVQLYVNLGTDRTFLFRHGDITEEVRVAAPSLDDALVRMEGVLREERRWLPRYSDLRYIRGHFSDIVQRELPCAESQLKLMVHSRGEVGGCWGHDPKDNVRERPLAEIIDGRAYREEHARLFRKDCVGCGSNYSLNLRCRPRSYVEDALWRIGRRSLARS